MPILCRTCVREINCFSEYFCLDGSYFGSNELQIRDVLLSCIPELVLKDVNLNSYDVMCRNCTFLLSSMYQFRLQALKNEKVFLSHTPPDDDNKLDVEEFGLEGSTEFKIELEIDETIVEEITGCDELPTVAGCDYMILKVGCVINSTENNEFSVEVVHEDIECIVTTDSPNQLENAKEIQGILIQKENYVTPSGVTNCNDFDTDGPIREEVNKTSEKNGDYEQINQKTTKFRHRKRKSFVLQPKFEYCSCGFKSISKRLINKHISICSKGKPYPSCTACPRRETRDTSNLCKNHRLF